MQELVYEKYQETKNNIRHEMEVATESFIKIGFYLKQVRDNKWYQQEDFTDIYAFAKGTFNIDRTTASRFMSINDKYSIDGNSIEIRKEFEGFGSSKLIEMLHMPEELITEIPTTATVKEIREIRKDMLPEKEVEVQLPGQMSVCDVTQMDLPQKDWMKVLVKEFFLGEGKTIFEDVFEKIKRPITFGTETIEQQVRILIAPSKYRFYRMAEANVMFNETRFSIMPRGVEKEEHTYQELIDCFFWMFQGEDAEESYFEVYEKKLKEELEKQLEEKKEEIPSIEEDIEEEEVEEQDEPVEEIEEGLEDSEDLDNCMNPPEVCDVAQNEKPIDSEQEVEIEEIVEREEFDESEEPVVEEGMEEIIESQGQQDIHTDEGVQVVPKKQTRFEYLKNSNMEEWVQCLSEGLKSTMNKEEIKEWLQEEIDG